MKTARPNANYEPGPGSYEVVSTLQKKKVVFGKSAQRPETADNHEVKPGNIFLYGNEAKIDNRPYKI